jgi:hypothetical protein
VGVVEVRQGSSNVSLNGSVLFVVCGDSFVILGVDNKGLNLFLLFIRVTNNVVKSSLLGFILSMESS